MVIFKFMELKNKTGFKGIVDIYRKYPDGTREFRQRAENIITNNGLYRYLDLMGGASTTGITAFAWGSGGLSGGLIIPKVATATGLVTQDGADLIDGYSRTSTTAIYQCVMTTAQGNVPGIINEFGLRDSGSTFMCMFSFASEAKTASFELEFDYTHTAQNV